MAEPIEQITSKRGRSSTPTGKSRHSSKSPKGLTLPRFRKSKPRASRKLSSSASLSGPPLSIHTSPPRRKPSQQKSPARFLKGFDFLYSPKRGRSRERTHTETPEVKGGASSDQSHPTEKRRWSTSPEKKGSQSLQTPSGRSRGRSHSTSPKVDEDEDDSNDVSCGAAVNSSSNGNSEDYQYPAPVVVREDGLYEWVEKSNVPPPIWVDTNTKKDCYHCQSRFKMGHRHNCRLCGKLFCSLCTGRFNLPTEFKKKGKEGPSRVCYSCRDIYLSSLTEETGEFVIKSLRPRLQIRIHPVSYRELISPPKWEPLEDCTNCAGCGIAFGKSFHHCRMCGHVFCEMCGPKLDLEIPPCFRMKNKTGQCRVCLECRWHHTGKNGAVLCATEDAVTWSRPSLTPSHKNRNSGSVSASTSALQRSSAGKCPPTTTEPVLVSSVSELKTLHEEPQQISEPKLEHELDSESEFDPALEPDEPQVPKLEPGPELEPKLEPQLKSKSELKLEPEPKPEPKPPLEIDRPPLVHSTFGGLKIDVTSPTSIQTIETQTISLQIDDGKREEKSNETQEEKVGEPQQVSPEGQDIESPEQKDKPSNEGHDYVQIGDDSELVMYNTLIPKVISTEALKNNHITHIEEKTDEIIIFDESSSTLERQPSGLLNFIYISTQDLSNVKRIGHGFYGVVFRAIYNLQYVVVKAPRHEPGEEDMYELKVHLRVPPNPNVLTAIAHCHNFFVSNDRDLGSPRPAIVSPYQLHGDLKAFLNKHDELMLSDQDYINLSIGMARGISHLHSCNIIHRDIALRNFLLGTSGRVKIADFGLSRILRNNAGKALYYRISKGALLPIWWCSPESLKNEKFDKGSDMWMLGIAMWELFNPQSRPFAECKNSFNFVSLFDDPSFGLELCDKMPKIIQSMIQLCMDREPKKRPHSTSVVNGLLMLGLPSIGLGSYEEENPDEISMQDQLDELKSHGGADLNIGDSKLKREDTWMNYVQDLDDIDADEIDDGDDTPDDTSDDTVDLPDDAVTDANERINLVLEQMDLVEKEESFTFHKKFGKAETRIIWCKRGRLHITKDYGVIKTYPLTSFKDVSLTKRDGDKTLLLKFKGTIPNHELEASSIEIRDKWRKAFRSIVKVVEGNNKKLKPQPDTRRPAEASPKDRSLAIEESLKKSHLSEKRKHIVLIGTSDSGKTELCRHLKTDYSKGEKKQFVRSAHSLVISAMQILILESDRLADISGYEQYRISKNTKSKAIVESCGLGDLVDQGLALHIRLLWADPAVQWTFASRTEFGFPNHAEYFFDNIERIGSYDYVPTSDDIVRLPAGKGMITEIPFELNNDRFVMIDVRNMKAAFRKWGHQFEETTAVIFVSSISDYDKVILNSSEGVEKNKLLADIEILERVGRSRWFRDADIFLFLNNIDIFEEKIKRTPLTEAFPEYIGDRHNFNQCKDYVQTRFENIFDPAKVLENRVQCLFVRCRDNSVVNQLFHCISNIG